MADLDRGTRGGRAPEGRGRALHLRDRRLDVPRRPRRALRRPERRVHQRAPRAGRRVHGRRPRARHRSARRVPGHQRSRRDQPAHRRGRRARGALAGGRPGRRRRARPCAEGRLPGIRPRLDVQAGDQARAPDHAARAHPRAAPRGAARGHDRPARPGAGRDPARRAERAARRRPSRWRATALPRHRIRCRRIRTPFARPSRLLRQAERPLLIVGGGVNRAGAGDLVVRLERAVRHPDDHRLRPQRRGAERAPALHRAARSRRRAGGRGGVPARRPPPGRRLAPRAVHHALRRSLHPSRTCRSCRSTSRAATSAATIRWPSASRPTRARRVRPCSTRSARDGGLAPTGPRGGRRPRRCARSGRRAWPARPSSTRSRSSPSACTRSCDACCRPTPSWRSTPAPRRPTATTACTSAGRSTFLTPLDLGGLGFAFPVALGAKLGRPESPVVAIHGDGGFLMNAHELETAVRHGINVVTIVMNNNCWGSEKAYQRAFYGGRYIGCDIGNPRYDAASRGCSAPRATTRRRPIRSATRCRRRSRAASRRWSRSRSIPTSSRRPWRRFAARGRRLARETPYPAPPISRAADERGRQECRDQSVAPVGLGQKHRDRHDHRGHRRRGQREQPHRGDRQRIDRPPTEPLEHLPHRREDVRRWAGLTGLDGPRHVEALAADADLHGVADEPDQHERDARDAAPPQDARHDPLDRRHDAPHPRPRAIIDRAR